MRILVFNLIAILCTYGALANSYDDRKVKEIDRQFKVKPGVTIDLINKYGQIVLTTWDKDSVNVKIRVTAYGRNRDAADKMMDRVDFDFSNTYSFLTIETVFDRNKGLFRDLINSVTDVSNTLLNTSRINVDYEILVPENAVVELQNRFGNIYVNQHAGKLEIDLSHGDLKASNLTGYADIQLSYGNANIRNMQDGRILLNGAELDLGKGSSVFIESSSSEIFIKDASTLRMDSRNDRIRIDAAGILSVDGNFSDVTVGTVFERLDADLVYGNLLCQMLSPGFSKVRVAASSGNVDINFDPLSDHEVEISAPVNRLSLPDIYDAIERREDATNRDNVVLKGRIGENKAERSVNVHVEDGALTITQRENIPYSIRNKQ